MKLYNVLLFIFITTITIIITRRFEMSIIDTCGGGEEKIEKDNR